MCKGGSVCVPSVSITLGTAAMTAGTPRSSISSWRVEPACTSDHTKPDWSWWSPMPYVGPRSSSMRYLRP